MFDPYTNRIPHGLLTEDENAALLATGGPWEYCSVRDGVWRPIDKPAWRNGGVYRAVRRPMPVPQEGDIWVDLHRGCFPFPFEARQDVTMLITSGWRLFREVKADD